MPGAPRLILLSGPNGAGKTTFSGRLLAAQDETLPFLNADIEARRRSPGDEAAAAISAGRAILSEMARLLVRRISFAVETTLSGKHHLRLCRRAKTDGWLVDLHYLSLETEELAKQRVAERVAAGGHEIPEDVIARRYWRGLANLPMFCGVVSRWAIHDNSGALPELVATGDTERVIIRMRERFGEISAASEHQWKSLLADRAR